MPITTQPVKHLGDFVLTKNGSIDFGEIPIDVAKVIGRQPGKIRLRTGIQTNNAQNSYGEKHIERPGRLADLKAAGFENARDFVEFVCDNYDAIYPNGIGLIILKHGYRCNTAYIQLVPSDDGDFYDVKTVVSSSRNYVKNKTPLWTKQSSV